MMDSFGCHYESQVVYDTWKNHALIYMKIWPLKNLPVAIHPLKPVQTFSDDWVTLNPLTCQLQFHSEIFHILLIVICDIHKYINIKHGTNLSSVN